MGTERMNAMRKGRSGIKRMNYGLAAIRAVLWIGLTATLCLGTTQGWADTNVSGTIATDTVWDLSGSPYIVTGTVTVQGTDGADGITTLTIMPGVEIRFNNSQRLYVGASSGDPGALIAQGTAAQPIVFTSNQATPQPGDWQNISFRNTADDASCVLDYCTVEYAASQAVYCYQASPRILNSTITNNSGYGIYVTSGSPTISGCSFSNNGNYDIYYPSTGGGSLTGNSLTNGFYLPSGSLDAVSGNTIAVNNGYPIRIPVDMVGDLMDDNTFSNVAADSAIEVAGGTITRDATWPSTIDYIILGIVTVQGTDGADGITTLTIAPGARIRFNSGQRLYVGSSSGDPGALIAQGTAAQRIVFTSNQETPQPGDWQSISFRNTADDATCVLDYCTIEYAASYAVYCYQASPRILNSTIANSNSYGIYISSGSPTISGCSFSNNGNYDIYYPSTGGGSLTGNSLTNGFYLPSGNLDAVSGNTIAVNNGYPIRIPVDMVGDLMDDNTFSNVAADSAIEVAGGTITSDATWPSTIDYIILGSVTVQGTDGADGITTLTIMPGVEIRFNNSQRLYVGSSSGDPGALIAQGTADQRIVFTSNQETPQPGDWQGISFRNTADDATCVLDYCTIEYAASYTVYCYQVSPRILNSTITNNSGYGIHVSYGSPTLSDNTIAGNGNYGIYLASSAATVSNNTFSNNGNYDIYYSSPDGGSLTGNSLTNGFYLPSGSLDAISGNTIAVNDGYPIRVPAGMVGGLINDNTFTNVTADSAIEVAGGTITRDAAWPSTFDYIVLGTITVRGTDGADGITTLTIAPGTRIRFNSGQILHVGAGSGDPGALVAQGTAAQRIVFTSNQATPQPGDWQYVSFQNTADDATCVLEHCIVEYASYGIYLTSAVPQLRYNIFRNNSQYGLYVGNSGSDNTAVDCSEFKDNQRGIYTSSGDLLTVRNCNFITNQEYGIHNSAGSAVDAADNWWNDADGPGQNGDTVYGNVTVSPWLSAASTCVDGSPVNSPPHQPASPQPADGAINVPFPDNRISLAWSGGDPNPYDTVTYDVRWGLAADSLGTIATDLSATGHDVTGLQPDTAYFWQIVARDNHGAASEGPVWQFTTRPPQADLIISDLTTAPATGITAGQTVTIRATVQNNGSGAVTSTFLVAYAINGQSLGTTTVSQDLSAGQSVQVERTWTALMGPAALTATADSASAIDEDNETNNGASLDLGTIPDTTPPEMTATAPADDSSHQTVNLITIDLIDRYGGSVDGTATAGTIVVTVNGGQTVAGTVSQSSNRFTFTPDTAPLPEGAYQVALTAHDTAGNSQAYTVNFTIDNQTPAAPVITGGSVTSGVIQVRPATNRSNKSAITLTGTREDNTAVLVNNSQRVGLGSGDWSAAISLPQGDNALEIQSRDAAGNTSASVWVDIRIDSIAPVVTGVTPADNSFLSSPPAMVTVNYTEATSGLDADASLRSLKDGSLNPLAGTWTDNAGSLQFTPGAPFADDTYTLDLRLNDQLGNASPQRQWVFTVDTTAPPAPQIDPVVSPTHAVTQTISGRKEAFAAIQLNGQQVVAATAQTTWQHTVTLTSGSNVLRFAAVDRAGNQSEPAEATIVFDDIAPPAVTTLTANGQGSGTSVLLNWSGYDESAHGDIETYRIYHETDSFSDVASLSVRAEVNAGTFAYAVQDLVTGTTYWFAVVPVDAMGNFTSAVTPVPAQPQDSQAPENVTALSVVSFADRLQFAWQPSADSQGDLAGYKVYFNNSTTPELLPSTQTAYERTGLAASGAFPFKITAYDANDNESSGATVTGYTWLDNPAGLSAEPFSGYVEIDWSAVSPAGHLKHYAVYARPDSPITSVQGLTPSLTTGGTHAKVAGLTNNQTYHFAVTAVNRSDGQRPDVTSVAATPVPDESGPELSNVQLDGQPLSDGQTVSQPGSVTLSATDPTGVSRLEFSLDGAPLEIDYDAPYACRLDILSWADGAHTLVIAAYDTLDNLSQLTYTLDVQLDPPPAPTIVQPTDGQLTNQAAVTVQGQSTPDTDVVVYHDGAAVGSPLTLDDADNFQTSLTLHEGANRIRAAARNRAGTGPMSQELTVTLDTSQPLPPRNLSAQALEEGVIRLTWEKPTGKLVSGYYIYRSDAPFEDPAAAARLNSEIIAADGYRDLTPEDGNWYYRLSSVDEAQNESALSNMVTAASDSTPPRLSEIQYSPQGNVDAISGAMAPGRVDLVLTVSEPLMAVPFFSITPQGGVPITIDLRQTSEVTYSGEFTIEPGTPTGTAYAIFSARDKVGNRGTEIDSGQSIVIDTDGPAVRRIVLAPATPIQNDNQAPVSISVTIGLTEAAAAGTAPALDYLLSGPGRTALAITPLAEIPATSGDAQTWQGQFELPADAGQIEAETLQLAHQTEDHLGNISTRILAPNRFQVYQGDLPPLAAPTGLTATALAGGLVRLGWNPVEGALGYRLYRQAPDESERTPFARIDGATAFDDATDLDGTYTYAVASIRSENGQEAESAPGDPVTVDADAQAPPAPQNLALQLTPQGILAQWEPSATQESVTYRLYRSDAAQITTVEGLSPIEGDITQTTALDRRPSPSDHSYAVCAVDEAGNLSVPSNSAYLNFTLLPVATLDVVQTDAEAPLISWTHPGGDLAGYDVYMGPPDQSVKVNTAPITDLSISDSGYAGDVRDYRVVAVDVNAVESPARSIRLPRIDAQLAPDSLLRRGIMNILDYQIRNRSGEPLDNLRLIAAIAGIDHPSDTFSLAVDETRSVPVIVGGYADLLDAEPLTTTIQMQPDPGETARLVRTGEILVGEGMLVLQLYSEQMTRGGTGKVWFTLENSGEADIEIVTAIQHGQKASPEIVFSLLDADGNILTTLDFLQVVGAGMVSLSSGDTVARIPAGAIFESAPMQIPVPSGAADELTLQLEIAAIYHRHDQDDELIMRGMTSSQAVSLVETPYTGEITAITPPVSAGHQEIDISGRAVMRDSGSPVPNAPLNLIVTLNGFERQVELTTDGGGNFNHTFTPLPGEAGTYKVAALHPDLLERPVQATFVVTKVEIHPSKIRVNIPKNYEQVIPIEVIAGDGTVVNNLRLEYNEWDQRADALIQGVTYDTGQPVTQLAAEEKATINLTLTTDNSAPDSGSLILRLVSDETGVQPWGYVEIEAQFTEAEPFLYFTPNFVESGVLLDDMATETVTLENKGLADLEGVTLSLVGENNTPVPDWVVLNGAADQGALAVGAKRDIPITFAPHATTPDGFYTFFLRVEADNYPTTDIGLYVSVTPDGIGNALFKITDIYTGTLNDRNELIQGLANARIRVQNEKNPTIVYDQTSDSLGEALFANLPAGIYKYRIQVESHQEKIGRMWIKPGLTTSEDIFLEYNLVTVEWEVVETTIEDVYDIVLTVTYETDVPAPVLVVDPPSVPVPAMQPGDTLTREFSITNHGLIRADNLKVISPPDDDYFKFELMIDVPESLGAKERITVPYRMTCLQSLNIGDDAQSGGGDGSYGACYRVTYSGVSVNGCPFSGSVPHCMAVTSSGGGGSGIPPSGGGGGGYVYGGQGGGTPGSSSGSRPETISGGPNVCTPAVGENGGNSGCGGSGGGPSCETKDCKQGGCQDTASWVNVFYRSYTDAAVDLSVKVPGGSIDIERAYYNMGYKYYVDSWRWRHERKIYFSFPERVYYNSHLVNSISREGDTFSIPGGAIYDIESNAGTEFLSDRDNLESKIWHLGGDLWRWQDRHGNWEHYRMVNQKAALSEWGDRTGTMAKLIYELPDGTVTTIPTGIADRNDRQVIWIETEPTETDGTLYRIRDIDNREIEYDITTRAGSSPCSVYQTFHYLNRYKDPEGNEAFFTYESISSFKWSSGAGDEPNSISGSSHSGNSSGGGGHSGSIAASAINLCKPQKRYGLVHKVDAAGRETTITYNADGGVSSVLDQNGEGHYFEYSYDPKTLAYYIQVRDTNGKVKEIFMDFNQEASRVDVNGRTVKTYDKDNRQYTTIDENGNKTVKSYDRWDNLVKVVFPDGGTVRYEYDLDLQKIIRKTDENGIVTQYQYDPQGRLVRRTEAHETVDERTTEFVYDTEGNLTTIRREGDAATDEAVTTMTYDADGNMETLTDPENNTTTFTYDVMGNVLTRTDAENRTWTYTYDRTGRLKTITDPLDQTTEYFYDAAGNKIREIDPRGKETQYEYDERDNLKKRINPALEETLFENTFDGRITRQTDGEGRSVRYEYDADGRLGKTIDGNANEIAMQYSGDGSGCPSCGGGSGDQPARIHFPTFTRELKYDGRGRKFAQRDLLGVDEEHITTFAYDLAGNLIAKNDAEGNRTTYAYDRLNRLVQVTDSGGGITTYAYDNRDNLIALTDAEDQTTEFAYDRNNRLIRETRPMGQQTNYAYDGAGNLIEKIDAKNQRTAYGYDQAGRLERIEYFAAGDHTTAVKTVTFSYDAAGNLTGYDDGTTSATYSYDDAYRKTGETVTFPGFAKSNQYTYYKNGFKESFTGPDGVDIGYLYDANNQLTGIQIPNVGMFTVNSYRWNRPTVETLPGGAKQHHVYDKLMRVSQIAATDPGDNLRMQYDYGYDKADNIVSKQTGDGDIAYEYDNQYRLTQAEGTDQSLESFQYDAVGNRIESFDTSGTWNYNANNELQSYADVTFDYDANGNMIQKNAGGVITKFFYNLEDRLERVEDGSGTVVARYYYDPFGRRLWKEVGATRTYFHYSDEGLVGEYDASGIETKAYGWRPGSTWSTDPVFMKIGSEYYWYHNDHLGTPQKLTTSSGAVVWSGKYTSFLEANIDASSTIINNLRAPGQYFDAETGLYYNWFRYYQPRTGRYLSVDPIGFEGEDENLYRYVYNNPSAWIDPNGLTVYTFTTLDCQINDCMRRPTPAAKAECLRQLMDDMPMSNANKRRIKNLIKNVEKKPKIKSPKKKPKHRKGKRKSTHDPHTKKRPGSSEKKDDRMPYQN